MKKVYEAPSVEFEVIETEDIMNESFEESGDMGLQSIIGGGSVEMDL